MFDVSQWIALLLFAALVAQDTTAGPQIRFCEPIVVGPVVGWIAGDFGIGVLIGIAAQLYWMGAVPAGMATFVDVGVATVAAAALGAFEMRSGAGMLGGGLAFLWIIPVGLAGSALTTGERRFNTWIEKRVVVEQPESPLLGVYHMAGWVMSGVRGIVTAGTGIVAGMLTIPVLTAVISGHVSGGLVWAGILGAGMGTTLGVVIRGGEKRWAVLGFLAALVFAALVIAAARLDWI